ncbi:hypothetical protein EYF80_005986 [Liparis tanakae]|uniref:Uncharacterized protein n=1 Tax=Liparis tanakae TaxID=230148 RepID=A0A4Z2J0K5_9TELE|nr:hypothetical protein EYF80_005986 [Liparis tanakae]
MRKVQSAVVRSARQQWGGCANGAISGASKPGKPAYQEAGCTEQWVGLVGSRSLFTLAHAFPLCSEKNRTKFLVRYKSFSGGRGWKALVAARPRLDCRDCRLAAGPSCGVGVLCDGDIRAPVHLSPIPEEYHADACVQSEVFPMRRGAFPSVITVYIRGLNHQPATSRSGVEPGVQELLGGMLGAFLSEGSSRGRNAIRPSVPK